ncbi:MAG: NAD-glutamate dehydrogenase, partial [Myxococcales bacterium]|nr:NAD-glutamate dehydrogenase [Myxococcales bacterium]
MTTAPTAALDELAKTAGVPVAQLETVHTLLASDGSFHPERLMQELRWFYAQIGLEAHYFETTPPELIARHVLALYGAKIIGKTSGAQVDIHLQSETDEMAIYACREDIEVASAVERRIERKFPRHRLQSYRTVGDASAKDVNTQLRLYYLTPPDYPEGEVDTEETDWKKVAPRSLDALLGDETRARYATVNEHAVRGLGPMIEYYHRPEKDAWQFIVAMRRGSTHSYFSAISDVVNYWGVHTRRKYVEQLKNDIIIYSFYIDGSTPEQTVVQIREDLSMIYVLPNTGLTPLFRARQLGAQEVVYAYAGWKFAHHFLSRGGATYEQLAPAFAKDPVRLGLLQQLKHRLSKDTFTEDRIYDAIVRHPELVKSLYADFRRYHFVSEDHDPAPYDPTHGAELESQIAKTVRSELDAQIFGALLAFNRHTLKTNFYRDRKMAICFRLDPAFIDTKEYPERPYAIFFLAGSEFRGFHVRFRDVARGGIRIVRSRNQQAYSKNIDRLFDECYQLALTQQRKNKDIPEGGSKGTILLSREHQDKDQIAFKKYVDALLDLLMPNSEVVDHYDREEILYLGPDEGTAELVDWASKHARARGYRFWKAFTTGKGVEMGGIPHDLYGMTTHSVHAYVLGTLERLGLDEAKLTKFQTGGPDGDLGSNEIMVSKDKTIAIVDGSGVLYDPAGIDREELLRLAKARQMVEHFARDRLGAEGFFVHID